MKKTRKLWLIVMACIVSLQLLAQVKPAYVYTAANNTLHLIKHDYSTPEPTVWDNQPVSSFHAYPRTANSVNDIPATVTSNATRVKIHAGLSDYSFTSTEVLFYNLTKVTTIEGMQYLNIDANTTTLSRMFYGCNSLTSIDLSRFDTRNVTNMSGLFEGCRSLTYLDVSHLNTANVTDMSSMFNGCSKLTALNVSNFNTEKVTNFANLFGGCSGLAALNVDNFRTQNVVNFSWMFAGCSKLTSLNVSHFDTRKATAIAGMFENCSGLSTINVSNFVTDNVTNMATVFRGCSGLTALDVTNFNTQNVTNMYGFFAGCHRLTNLDVTRFDTRKVKAMNEMFSDCYALTALDVSNFNTQSLTVMYAMFNGCRSLSTLDLTSFNTDKVTNMGLLFNGCNNLSQVNLSSFNTALVQTMRTMFGECRSLRNVNVSHFNTEKVTDMYGMFSGCTNLAAIDVSNFNTSNVLNMEGMFRTCSSLFELNLSNFNTEKVIRMQEMFASCSRLKTLTLNNFDGRSLISGAMAGFLNNTNNLEYVDMTQATNIAPQHQTAIAISTPNAFTLKYMPKGSSIAGKNVITTTDGINFTCQEYVVADDTLTRYTGANLAPNTNSPTAMKWEVNIPYGFTADKVTNTRKIGAKAGSTYTWFMPYSAPIPAGVQVYEFAANTVDGMVATFVPTTDTELKAQKPYLVKSTVGEVSTSVPATSVVPAYTPGTDVVAAATSDGWSFIGFFQWRTTERAATEGLHTLQTGNLWKTYEGSTAKPRPFRAYLKKSASGARQLSTHFDEAAGITGIEQIELLDTTDANNSRIYDLNGRYLGTRRDRLASGVYVIDGKTTRVN